MLSSPLPTELVTAAPAFAGRVGSILRALYALIAHAFLRDPRRVALILPLCAYLTSTIHRFECAMARLATGAPQARRTRSGRSGPRANALPRTRAWLIEALGYHAVGFASQLNHLLAEPDFARLLAGAPQAARILRPVCHLLGISPAALARPRPARPAPARPAPDRPAAAVPSPAQASHGAAQARRNAGPATHSPLPAPPPLAESAPCPHVLWPWYPRRDPPAAWPARRPIVNPLRIDELPIG